MSQVDFEEIQEELDIEYLLDRESVAFKVTRGSSGMQLNIKECPACGDSRWRTYFGLETGRGNCFKCNTPFNKVSFAKHLFDTDWSATKKILIEALEEQGWRPKRVYEAAVDPGEVKLPVSIPLPTPEGQNLQYLEDRGFTGEIAAYFHLRYCQHGWWIYEQEGETKYQTFDSRVIIPVFDLDGSLKTFQGRDVTGTSERKYLFPIALPGTGRYLYNAHNILNAKHVVLGEGAFDVAAIKVAFDQDPDLRQVVAIGSFGKHLSMGDTGGNDQLGRFIKLKHAGLEQVTIMWDGEPAALEAALTAAKHLAGIGLVPKIALLPKGKDPNEVPAHVVRQAYLDAQVWTPSLDIKLRLRNPFR